MQQFDGKLRLLCDKSNPNEIMHSNEITHLYSLQDGGFLSTSKDNTMIVWNGDDKKIFKNSGVTSICQLSDGLVATASKTIKIWNLDTGIETCIYNDNVECLCSLSDNLSNGNLLSASDNIVKGWNYATGKRTMTLGCNSAIYSMLQFENILATQTSTCIQLWDLRSRKIVNNIYGNIYSMCKLQDNILAIGSTYRIKLWDIRKGLLKEIKTYCSNNNDSLYPLQDGRILSTSDDTIYVWNMETEKCQTIHYQGDKVCQLVDGRVIVARKDYVIGVLI